MPSTVIISRHGSSLYLLPAAGPALDLERLREVLGRHGLSLLEGSDLRAAHELIAAEGLGPAETAALAEDLRGMGLHVRVVNRGALTTSRRVSTALAAQFMLALAGLPLLVTGGTLGAAPLVLGAVLVLFAAFNALALSRGGGALLRVAATQQGAVPQLTARLETVLAALPEHLAAPLRERARALAVHVASDPDGQATAELRALVDDLRGHSDEQAAADARQLREQITLARRALRETPRG